MPLLSNILNFVGDNLPWTPMGRGILAAREQQQMSQYRNQMMQRQQQQFDLEKTQFDNAQRMFKPGAAHPDQIPVTPTVGSPGYDEARQKFDNTDIGTASAVDYLKGPASQVAQSLAGAGQFQSAAQLLKENVPQAPQWQEETVSGLAGQRDTKTGKFDPFPQSQSASAPVTREIPMGNEVVTFERVGDQWKEIARGPRWQPQVGTAADRESWGQPVTEAGPDGKDIQVRYGNRGGRQVVQGATPQPRTRDPNQKIIGDIGKAGTNVETMTRLSESFQDRYGGRPLTGELSNMVGRTFGDDTGQAQWWQDYQSYMNQIRNQLFGSALTATEKNEFIKAQVTPGMAPGEIKKNLSRQRELFRAAALRQVNPYLAGGYNKDVIEGALGMGVDDLRGEAKAPAEKPAAQPTDQAPAGVDPELWKHATPEERALWK